MEKNSHLFFMYSALQALYPSFQEKLTLLKTKIIHYQTDLNAAFAKAVLKGDAVEVAKLIDDGADRNTPIKHVVTAGDCDWDVTSSPLMYAIISYFSDLIPLLVVKDQNLDEELCRAIEDSSHEIALQLIELGAKYSLYK